MRSFRSLLPIAGLAICGFLLAGGIACAPQIVFADDGWRSVVLPARPLSITSSAAILWVCGTDEMIARSSDGGQTWQLKHQITDALFCGQKTAVKPGHPRKLELRLSSTFPSAMTSTVSGRLVLQRKSATTPEPPGLRSQNLKRTRTSRNSKSWVG